MEIPIIMNMIPAIFVIIVLLILFTRSLPRERAIRDNSNNLLSRKQGWLQVIDEDVSWFWRVEQE